MQTVRRASYTVCLLADFVTFYTGQVRR